MSEQLPPGYGQNAPAGPPPGWYPDLIGRQGLRWWDGTQWGQETRPGPGSAPEGQPLYPSQREQPRQPSFTSSPQYGAPPGQPSYQGQPYGPSGQQPYSGPGNGGGYGPQPPRRRRKRHLVRNILAGIGAVIVAIIAITALASHGNGVSTTPSGNSSTSSTASSPASKPKVAGVGSYFDVQDGSGDTYRVTLVKVIDPAQGADQFNTPDSGNRFVGAVFTIKALSGSPQDEDANDDAAVVGSNGQTYNADVDDIAGYTNFSNGQINVAQGDTTTGAVVFQVPDGIKVTEVQWSTSAGFGSTVQWDVRG